MSSNPVPRIFVVDDEPVIASTLAAILQMNGFSAKFFTCPLDALAAARLKAPDLLISDVAMPGISGIELAIQMKAQYPTCKVLLFSGQAATMDLLEDARAQGHDFDLLLKPVPPTEFLLEVGKDGECHEPNQCRSPRSVVVDRCYRVPVGPALRLHKQLAIGMVKPVRLTSPSESRRESLTGV